MRIRLPEQVPDGPARRSGSGRPAAVVRALVLALLVCSVTCLLTLYFATNRFAEWTRSRGQNAFHRDVSLLRKALLVPKRLLTPDEAPRLIIDIKFKHMQTLQRKRAEALESGLLIQGADDFVPATIRHEGRTTRVKLRLKGDMIDHLRGDKWSFRIHVKDGDHILGMRRFSIQHPATRGFQGEPLFFDTLRHLGVMTPRYFFVKATVNGADIGVMALEEHFAKEMIESQSRRESVIVKLDEALFWAMGGTVRLTPTPNPFNNYLNAPVGVFGEKRVEASASLRGAYASAAGLLRGFIGGEVAAHDAFDAELTGRYLAAADLWGTPHALFWNNQRFYFNPMTGKLEPIGFDAEVQRILRRGSRLMTPMEPITQAWRADPEIFDAYLRALRSLCRGAVDGALLERLRRAEALHLPALQKEFFLLQPFPLDLLARRAAELLELSDDELKDALHVRDYPAVLHARDVREAEPPYVELANAVPHPVEVSAMQWVDPDSGARLPFEPVDTLVYPVELPPTRCGERPEPRRVAYVAPPDPLRHGLWVEARVRGHDRLHELRALPCPPALAEPVVPDSSLDEALRRHSFLRFEPDSRTITVVPGEWQIRGTLAVPPGLRLAVPAGTTLRFAPDGLFISRGVLAFEGTEEAPIVLEGLHDAEDGPGAWPGRPEPVVARDRPQHHRCPAGWLVPDRRDNLLPQRREHAPLQVRGQPGGRRAEHRRLP
ncbi:hypothetical protein ACFLSJ_08810, partial [Verrucomicrobiota bacterium]